MNRYIVYSKPALVVKGSHGGEVLATLAHIEVGSIDKDIWSAVKHISIQIIRFSAC